MLAIVRKEWRQFIDTPLAYVVATAFILVCGFLFSNTLFLVGQADMRNFFGWLPLLYTFFLPALAMRLLAEEKRSGTFELLATLPVDMLSIAAGKLLAVWLQVLLLLALTLIYPLSLAWLGNVDGGQIMAAYGAAMLLALAYAAIGLFASALTANGVVAYVIGLGLLLALQLLAQAAAVMPPAAQHWIELLSPLQHYDNLVRGVVDLADAVFLLAATAVFFAATVFQLERRRWA